MKKTLLFGNGFNRAVEDEQNQPSWTELLKAIGCQINLLKCEQKCGQHIQNVSNTLLYENAFLSNSTISDEADIKNKVVKIMREIRSNELYEKAIKSNFDEYITTNYDNAFIECIEFCNGEEVDSDNSEKIYSIRRHLEFNVENRTIKLWHIHGNLSNYKSIQLGLDHYAGSIGKIDAYLKGNYEYVIEGKNKKILEVVDKHHLKKNKRLDRISWIDLFFDSNIHIIGLALDYSEIDLWWILNKRARLMKSGKVVTNNKVTYYSNSEIDPGKKQLLESFNVKVVEVVRYKENNSIDYKMGILEALDIAYKS